MRAAVQELQPPWSFTRLPQPLPLLPPMLQMPLCSVFPVDLKLAVLRDFPRTLVPGGREHDGCLHPAPCAGVGARFHLP